MPRIRSQPDHCTARLAPDRRSQVNVTFRCAPIDYARAWPAASSATVAVVVALTSAVQTERLQQTLPSWDQHLLGPLTALVAHFDLSQPVQAVAAQLALDWSPRCSLALPNDYSCGCTRRSNPAILLQRPFQVPAVLSNVPAAAQLRPRSFCSAHKMEYVLGKFSPMRCAPLGSHSCDPSQRRYKILHITDALAGGTLSLRFLCQG